MIQLTLALSIPGAAADTAPELPVIVPSEEAARAMGLSPLEHAQLCAVLRSETMMAATAPPFVDPARVDPPSDARSEVVVADKPYRPLPKVTGPPDGHFLTARVPGYADTGSSAFEARMAQVEVEFMERLVDLRSRAPLTAAHIEDLIHTMGEGRRRIQCDLFGEKAARNHGLPVGEKHSRGVDYVYEAADTRHHAYYPRAARWAQELASIERELEAAGGYALGSRRHRAILVCAEGEIRQGRLCAPDLDGEQLDAPCVKIRHPDGREAAAMRQCAYELLAQVANGPYYIPGLALSEEEAMKTMGKAHFLLMHATPFICGSPSIVETGIDGILRSTLDVHLPGKRPGCEPFWEAVFTLASQMHGYARQYRNFYV